MSAEPTALFFEIPAPDRLDPLQLEEAIAQVEFFMFHLAAGARLDKCGAIVGEHLATGGKRLRARLALAACAALGASVSDGVGWAAACELLHNASLVHDDLQDGDRTRRGQPTTWVRHGLPQAINAGDLLLMLPTLAVEQVPAPDAVRWQLARGIADHAAETVRGQALDLSLLPSRRTTWEDYEQATSGKTAALLSLPVFGAALIAGRDLATASALARALRPLGVLFQAQDDVLDLFGNKGRSRVGSDIREGKVSALVAEHLRLYPEDADWLLEILEMPRDETPDHIVEAVRLRFRDGGALEEVLDRIYALARSVFLSTTLAREPELHRVARFLVERMLDPIRHLDPSLPTEETIR
jgi:geranylgeranyl diphosphate synthase type I